MAVAHVLFPCKSLKISLLVVEMLTLGLMALQSPVAADPSAPQGYTPPSFPLQLLTRVVVKEVRGWCGYMVRKRGYVHTTPGWPLVPQCQNTASMLLWKDVCYPLLSLLHHCTGITSGVARPAA